MAAKDSSASESSADHTVFVDTNLDTHFAMIVSAEDTVTDLKMKIMVEHLRCFPNIGEITIDALKIKRRRCFYHLVDSMLVRSAFHGVTKSWFLQIDVSPSKAGFREYLNFLEPGASDQLACVRVTNGPSAERTTLLSGCPSKKMTIVDCSSLPQVGSSQVVNQKDHPILQLCAGNTGTEVPKDLSIGVKSKAEEHFKYSSSEANKGSGSEAVKKGNLLSQGKEDSGTHTPQKDTTENRILDMKCDGMVGDSLADGAVAKKENSVNNAMDVPLKDHDVGRSELENTLKNTLKVSKKVKDTYLVDLSTKLLDDDHLLSTSLSNENKKRRKKKKSSFTDEVNSTVPSSVENVKQDISKKAFEGNQKDMGKESDAVVLPEQTFAVASPTNLSAIIEKQKPSVPVEEVPASDQVVASEAKKTKKLKKRHRADANCLNDPLVGETDNFSKDLVGENAVPDDDNFVTNRPGKTEGVENSLSRNGVHKMMPSEVPNSENDSLVQDDREMSMKDKFVLSKLFNTSVISEIGDKRRKKNKVKDSDAKSLALSSGVKNARNDGDVIPLRVEPHKALTSNYPGDESDREHSIISRTKREKLSKARTPDTSLLGTDQEADKVIGGDVSLPLTQINKILETSDDCNDNVRTKNLLSQSCDPKAMPSEIPTAKSGSFVQYEAKLNMKNIALSRLLDTSGISGTSELSSKLRKKSKKAKHSDVKSHTLPSSIRHDSINGDAIPSQSEPQKDVSSEHPVDESEKEGKIAPNASLLDIDKEADRVDDDSSPLAKITKIQDIADDSGGKVKKKSKKIHTSIAKTSSTLQVKEHDFGTEDPEPSVDEKKENNSVSKKTKRQKLGKTIHADQLTGSTLEAQEGSNSKIRDEYPQLYLISGTNGSPDILHDVRECYSEGNRQVVNTKNDYLVNDHENKGNNMEVPEVDSDRVNFIDYFVHSQNQCEVVAPAKDLVGKEIQTKKSEELQVNKKSKRLNSQNKGTSSDLESSFKSSDKQGHKINPGSLTERIQIQRPYSETEQNVLIPYHNGVKGQISHYQDAFGAVSNEISEGKNFYSSGLNNSSRLPLTQGPPRASSNNMKGKSATRTASSSSPEEGVYQNKGGRELQLQSNNYRVVSRKASGKKTGEVLNSSNHVKSLLSTPGTIFKESSSETSEGEGEINDSGASTKSPSDSSSSSDYSEGKDPDVVDSPHNGSYRVKGKGNGGNNMTISQKPKITSSFGSHTNTNVYATFFHLPGFSECKVGSIFHAHFALFPFGN
ncbi:PREDICTED: uncharacterized protein LOC104591580 isoform X2 [Nelumbo nucifera]|uniref:Dentin sialophosphoprotein-like n=2 Tax=Nelumbo nucifera TaxID=4432 RepID=A0A822YE80_NELNU|nr:PREDICTED: uncharacterized protein LOC104591580 isoform X2 [Nelumbo nucifera]DAD30702.1 TPA_asm: hypothetical protein HUJ06_009553 [Nelumbo nucifera]